MNWDNELYYLVYISRQRYPLTRRELGAMLDEAERFNRDHQITGMLVYRGGSFLQVLEGPKRDITQLYEAIERDDRHCNVEMIIFEPAKQRYFREWTMGFCELASATDKEHRAYSTFLTQGLCARNAPMTPSIPASLLSMFVHDFSTRAQVIH